MAGGAIGIDHSEPGVKQRRTDAATLSVRMDAESLQVPDRLVRECPLQGCAGSDEARERPWCGDGDVHQGWRHPGLTQRAQRKPTRTLPQRHARQVIVQIRTDHAAVEGGIPCGRGLKGHEDPMADPGVGEVNPERWVIVVASGQQRASRCGVAGAEQIESQIHHAQVPSVRALHLGDTTTQEAPTTMGSDQAAMRAEPSTETVNVTQLDGKFEGLGV